jgi:hypothetical protein
LNKLGVCKPGQARRCLADDVIKATCHLTQATCHLASATCHLAQATWPVYLLYLSSAGCRLTKLIVDNTHQLCVGFEGQQRVWTSCGYASQVRRVGG